MRLLGPGLAALVELRLLLVWRRLRRPGGTAEGVARVVLHGMALVLGLVLAALMAAGSYRAAGVGGTSAAIGVAAIFFGIWQAWTAVSLVVADRDALDLRRFLAYPIPPWRAWILGLVAGVVGDPFALFWLVMLGGVLAGAAAARPGPWLALLALDLGLFAVATLALVGLLQEILAKLLRLRWARELGILAGAGGWILLASLAAARGHGAAALVRLSAVLYPPSLATAAARALYAGRSTAALPHLAALAGAAAATLWLAWRLALGAALGGQEGRAPSPRGGRSGRSPWPERLGPVFEKEMKYLLRHPVPRVALLVLPALGAVAAWKVLPILPADSAPVLRALPLFALSAFSWLMLQDLWLNGFGLDRGGARALFLAPLCLEDVLRQKNGAMALLASGVFLLAAATYLSVGGLPPAWALAGALALHGALAPVYLGLGNVASALLPAAASFSYQRGRRPSALAALAGMAVLSAGAGLMSAPVLLAIRLDEPWALALGWALLGVLAWVLYRRSLPAMARLLERRREQVLAAVCGEEA